MTSAPTIALCGAGMIASVHALAAQRAGLRVVAVASRSGERAAELASRCGARPVVYDDLPAGAAIVVVATPPGNHRHDARRALDAGAAVVVEKPLCTTLRDADELVERGGTRLLYAENLACAPLVVELLRQAHELGPLDYVEVRALQGPPTWGAFTTAEWGGGALFDLGAHPLAVALLLLGQAPVSVRCTLRGDPAGQHPADVHGEVHLLTADVRRARVEASWDDTVQVWDVQASSPRGVVRAELFPTPTLERDGEPVAWPAGPASEPPLLVEAGYAGQLAVFVTDLEARRRPAMDAGFGRHVLEVTCAAYASAGRGGTEVCLPFSGPRDRTPLELWREPPR